MYDRERVMKELSWLINNFPLQKDPKDAADKMCNAINTYCSDALSLLKEQEPRVMTREEVIHSKDWIWYEWKNTHYGWTVAVNCDGKWIEWEDSTTDQLCEYGKKWRCWTSRPTPEQMRDTPWEGEENHEK